MQHAIIRSWPPERRRVWLTFARLWLVACASLYGMAPAGAQSVTYQTLYPFGITANNDGHTPVARLIQAKNGNFYGTTQFGGDNNKGTVFQITPAGVETIIHSFSGPDGNQPFGGVIQAKDGDFYGTTYLGGDNGQGVVFKVSSAGDFSVLWSFTGGVDGQNPWCTLTQATDGNFYGTTQAIPVDSNTPEGTVFRITPGGVLTTIYTFQHGNPDIDGESPRGGVIQGSDGNLYGTTYAGGVFNEGCIYKVTLDGVETVLYSFFNGNGGIHDGATPYGSLVEAADGNFYGTTNAGGAGTGSGTIFKITPSGVFSTIHSFQGRPTDGQDAFDSPTLGADGNLYGTTYEGGANGFGCIYRITPGGNEAQLYSFGNTAGDGFNVVAGLVQGTDLTFYGCTSAGGAGGRGTIYTFSLNGTGPVVTALNPLSVRACGPALAITLTGSNFVSGAVVKWNGVSLVTTFVSSTQLTAVVPAGKLAAPGYATVTVVQNSQTSNAATFSITNPLPVLSSLSPTSANSGGPDLTLTVKGKCFINGSTVQWNGSSLSTTYISATQLQATVPAADTANPGKTQVTVVTPPGGGGTSVSKTFTILLTTLQLTGQSVVKNPDGSYTATLSLKNVGFRTAASALLKKSALGPAITTTHLPVSLGNISAGQTANVALNYPSTAGGSGTVVSLTASGAFTGGTFSAKVNVTLP